MGGQSYKCPHCAKWVLTQGALRDHLWSKHSLRGFEIRGVGPAVELVVQETRQTRSKTV